MRRASKGFDEAVVRRRQKKSPANRPGSFIWIVQADQYFATIGARAPVEVIVHAGADDIAVEARSGLRTTPKKLRAGSRERVAERVEEARRSRTLPRS